MPDVEIVKLKIRRGPDATRKLVILEQGELGYTTDNKRLWVGDGVNPGGGIVGNVIHAPSVRTAIPRATTGDLVYDNNALYQLTGSDYASASDWSFIGTQIDTSFFTYDTSNNLQLAQDSIHPRELGSDVVDSTGGITLNSQGLAVNVDGATINATGNELSVGLINEDNIDAAALGTGLSGGSGDTILLDVNPSQFVFAGSTLNIQAVPAGSVDVAALSANSIGDGLQITGDKLEAVVQSVDTSNSSLTFVDNEVALYQKYVGNTTANALDHVTYDEYGRYDSKTGLLPSLSADEVTSPTDVFNGYVDQTTYTNQTIIPTISSNGVSTATVNLTSAGFIQVETSAGILAIPVFQPPQ